MRWRLEFYSERRRTLTRYTVEAREPGEHGACSTRLSGLVAKTPTAGFSIGSQAMGRRVDQDGRCVDR